MTDWTEAVDLLEERDERGLMSRIGPGALAFALSAALGVWLIYLRPTTHTPPTLEVVAKADVNPFGDIGPVNPPTQALSAPKAENPFGGLVNQGFGSSPHFDLAEREVPVPPVPPNDLRPLDEDEAPPLPPRRPNGFSRSVESQPAPQVVARLEQPTPAQSPSPTAQPNVFERLFGGSQTSGRTTDTKVSAYAPPPPPSVGAGTTMMGRGGNSSPGGFGGFLRGLTFSNSSSPTSRYGDHVAVYDISARMVYLPDGSTIEAHSGLGDARDNPSKVNERDRGPTPPATYALTPREELFHGVAALRLTPLEGSVYGRAGLLAHTYMLGPNGDSNGCVSFRDYNAFLRAFQNGQITKLVVVSRL